jgi:hypothetical protein
VPGSDKSRRKYERKPIRTETLIVEVRAGAGVTLAGRTRNISPSGAFIETTKTLPTGTEIQLFIGSMSSPAALRTVARVVHVEPGIGFGVAFLDVDDESRGYVATFMERFCRPEKPGRPERDKKG